MSFSLKDVDRIRYKPLKAAEEFLGDIRSALGVGDKATVARLAIARSVCEPATIKEYRAMDGSQERGSSIEGVHLFGDDSDLWATVLVSIALDPIEEPAAFRRLVEFHWARGAQLLEQDYQDVSRSDYDFVVRLTSLLPQVGDFSSNRTNSAINAVMRPIFLQLLRATEPWQMNASGGNGLLVISGGPGRGKSQLALDLLQQLSGQGVPFLFFDLKGELEDDPENRQQQEKRNSFLNTTGAEYVRLISSALPINPLPSGDTSAERAQIASEIASLVKAFASQLGANQERSIRDAFEGLNNPDFAQLLESMRENGAEGVAVSVLDKLVSFDIFSGASKCVRMDEWLQRSRVIDFKGLGNDGETKALIVAFTLNAIMRQMNTNLPPVDGVQPIRMVLFVDEAHLLLPKEGKAGLLGSLARQGRSWGFPIWLASQDADAFLTKGVHACNFAELADCGVHLSPETLSEGAQRQILGQTVSKKLAQGQGVVRLRGKTAIGEVRQLWVDKGNVASVRALVS